MTPSAARVVITVVLLFLVIAGVSIVNSFYGGSFALGMIIIVLPFLLLAHLLPRLLPVKCPKCRGRMRFRRIILPVAGADRPGERYGFSCVSCPANHVWGGTSSGSIL